MLREKTTYGTNGSDVLFGSVMRDDFIFGRSGSDQIGDKSSKGDSDDSYHGGRGQDTLISRGGNDHLDGGVGLDNFLIYSSPADEGRNTVEVDGGEGIDNVFLYGFNEDDFHVKHFRGTTIISDENMRVIIHGDVEKWEFAL